MAKTEAYKIGAGGGAGLAEDERADEFLRPAAIPRTRTRTGSKPAAFPSALEDRQDDDAEDDEVFLRSRKRVPVRKGVVPRFLISSTIGRVALGLLFVGVIAVLIAAGMAVKHFFDHDPRFRIDSASSIQIMGNSQLTRPELLSVFGADIGRNLFFVPLAERRKDLEQVPWVAHATVMRLLPNQLRVSIVERTPIAFARVGNQIKLVDGDGVILNMAPAALAAEHYSFPVVSGINPDDPLSTRGPRMNIYQKFMKEIDSGGEKVSPQLSEIDISDPEDVQGVISSGNSDILLHFGQDNFLDRWKEYQAHLAEWKQQYPHLASVDLRYDGQVVLKMADNAPATPAVQAATNATQDTPAAPAKQAPLKKTARPAAHPHRKRA